MYTFYNAIGTYCNKLDDGKNFKDMDLSYSARHRLGNGRLIEILTSMLHFIEKVIYLFKKKFTFNSYLKSLVN